MNRSKWILLTTILTGCMVGPNYKPPVQWIPAKYKESEVISTSPCVDEDLTHWWDSFHDPCLNALLKEALATNFDLKIAYQKICEARASYNISQANMLPEVDADFMVTRSRTSQTLNATNFLRLPPIQNFYQTGLDVIWQIDLFGGLQRAARAAFATWQATLEDARGVRIVLLSDVAATYTNIAALLKMRDVAFETIRLDQEILEMNQARLEAGLGDLQHVETALARLEEDRASLLVLETNLKQTFYSLGVLLGRPPESLPELCPNSIPCAIGMVPIGLPADLLRRRPDIRAAERRLASATEEIGVAVADLFPKFSLTGSSSSFSANPLQGANIGYASNSFSKLFSGASRIWGLGTLISAPIFDFGKRCEMVRQRVAIKNELFWTYEKAIVTSFQEVEASLVAYYNECVRLNALKNAARANKWNHDLTFDLYQAGLTDYIQVLQQKETWLVSLSDQIASEQALAINLIRLYKALGGGWQCCCTP